MGELETGVRRGGTKSQRCGLLSSWFTPIALDRIVKSICFCSSFSAEVADRRDVGEKYSFSHLAVMAGSWIVTVRFSILPPDGDAVWRAVGAGSNFHLGARGELDGAKLGVCKGAVAERQIHLEGMRGGFPIEAGFFEVGALSAFKGITLDSTF